MSDTNSLSILFDNFSLFGQAILCGVLAGIMLGYLGVFVVLRRMVFASAAISQGAALGVALSFLFEIVFSFGEHTARHITGSEEGFTLSALVFDPLVWAVICALGVTLVLISDPQRFRLTRESVLGLTFLATGSGAVIVGEKITQEAHDINAILFGSAVVVREIDLVMVAAACVLVLATQLWWRRALVFASYDPAGARVAGLPVGRLNVLLFVSLGIAVALATRALGAMPVFGFSVLPAMIALALTSRIGLVFGLSTIIGALGAAGGYALAFVMELPVGATQTALLAVVLIVVVIGKALLRR